MAASAEFLTHLRDLMRDLMAGGGPVSHKRMFGGAGIYADGLMFGIVIGDALYLKADARTTPAYLAEGLGPFVYDGKSKPITVNYWRVPERLYDDPDEMCAWAREAIAVARRAAATRGGTPRRRRPKR